MASRPIQKIIVVDFGATLCPQLMIDKVNKIRSQILQTSLPTLKMHAQNEKLYSVNNDAVEKLTGIKSDIHITQTDLNLDEITLSGSQIQTQIATNLFQFAMYLVANTHKTDFLNQTLIEELRKLKDKCFSIAIVSGVRTDIISGVLHIVGASDVFTYIYGQPSTLGVSNDENYAELSQHGLITHIIGDKLSDLKPAQTIGCQSIFYPFGCPTGDEEEFADYTLKDFAELSCIIN